MVQSYEQNREAAVSADGAVERFMRSMAFG